MILTKALPLQRVTLHEAVASLTVPSDAAADGGSVLHWRFVEGFGYDAASIKIKASGATSVGALGLYAVDDHDDISFIALLNNGETISVLNGVICFSQVVFGVGIAKRLIVGGVTGTVTPTSGATLTITATPIITMEYPRI